MITIRGKEIKPETITLWLNIISFLVGVIFYADMIFNFSHPPTEIIPENKAKDSLLVIDARLHEDITGLKMQQDSLVYELRNNQVKADKGMQQEVTERKQLYSTIHSDWDKLPAQVQDNYVNQLLIKLKKQ
jgi:hypothetical protein